MATSRSIACVDAAQTLTAMVSSPGEQVLVRYLQDANLPGFLIIAVFAGLDLSLEVAEPVGEKLFIQLVVVSLLTRDYQLFLLTGYLMRIARTNRNVRLNITVFNVLYFMNSHHERALNKFFGATFYMGTQTNTHLFLQSPQIHMILVQFTLSMVAMALCFL